MGSRHKAHCKCGFKTVVTVGGGMDNFHKVSYFPHYCKKCGLVEPNIALTENQGIVPYCPKCDSNKLKEYGRPPASKPLFGNEVALQWDSYHAMVKGNICPACEKMTLIFEPCPEILFD